MTNIRKQLELAAEYENLWSDAETGITKAPAIINDLCSRYCIINNLFMPIMVGQKEITNHIRKSLGAFSHIKLNFKTRTVNNNTIRIEHEANFTHTNMFFNFIPSNKRVQVFGYTFCKIFNDKITNIYVFNNILMVMVKRGSIPLNFVNDTNTILVQEKSNNIIEIIKKHFNDKLTNKEIFVMGLWLKGFSIKESANIVNLSSRTIEDYRSKIKEKLKMADKKYLYDYAKQTGILELFWSFK